MAFGGAINVIFPPRRSGERVFTKTFRFNPDDIQDLKDDDKSIESEILSLITHRSNSLLLWRHISPERVSRAILQRRIDRAIALAKAGGDDSESQIAFYEELLCVPCQGTIVPSEKVRPGQLALRPEAQGAVQEVTNGLKHSLKRPQQGVSRSCGPQRK